ncbi:phage recombination protein Bet [Stenotrophomonas indicatrix]
MGDVPPVRTKKTPQASRGSAPALSAPIPSTPAEQAEAIRTALKTSLYPGATDDSVDMVLAYCRAGGLDPMTKPVHIVPMWVPEKKQGNRVVSPAGMRDVIMPGIELYRTKAHRTGEYAGQDEATFGPTIEDTLSGVRVRYRCAPRRRQWPASRHRAPHRARSSRSSWARSWT